MPKRKQLMAEESEPQFLKRKKSEKKKLSASVKRASEDGKAEIVELVAPVRKSDEQHVRRGKWTNKNRVLVFSSRGIGFRDRHLMNDLKTIMPHSKGENKMSKKDKIFQINEACEMKNCNLTMYFEARKGKDLYVWFSKTPDGPSAKFLVENIHTMDELKMTGNCLKIVEEDGALAEVGPRLTLNLIKIFDGSFRGECIYENPRYVSPNLHRRNARLAAAGKYITRVHNKVGREERKPETAYPLQDETDDIFQREDKMDLEQSKSDAGNSPLKSNLKGSKVVKLQK